ncbi:MAG: lysylphosphatidylglycerol synthase domain-containing protein, partial [Cyclobacteriaceae bacterium]
MDKQHGKILAFFRIRRLILPILLGLGAASYLLIRNFDSSAFNAINWAWQSFFFLSMAVLMMVVRDLGYMYRLRVLTDGQISWRRSFDVIMLWEFASAITPSIIGGSAVALYIVHKEGVSMGRTTAIVLITAFLDEMFNILMVPLIILLVGTQHLFTNDGEYLLFNARFGTQGIFLIGYFFILVLTSIITYGIFINSRGLKLAL